MNSLIAVHCYFEDNMKDWKEEVIELLESEFKTEIKDFDIDIDMNRTMSLFNIEHDGECRFDHYSYCDRDGQLFLFIPNSDDIVVKLNQIVKGGVEVPGVKRVHITKSETTLTI